jgi:hypothetical protein
MHLYSKIWRKLRLNRANPIKTRHSRAPECSVAPPRARPRRPPAPRLPAPPAHVPQAASHVPQAARAPRRLERQERHGVHAATPCPRLERRAAVILPAWRGTTAARLSSCPARAALHRAPAAMPALKGPCSTGRARTTRRRPARARAAPERPLL